MSGQPHVPVALTQYPLNRRLGGPRDGVGVFEEETSLAPATVHWPLFVNFIQLLTEELSTTIRLYLWIYDMFRPGGSPLTSSSNMWQWEVPNFTYLKCTFQVNRCYKNCETRNNVCGAFHHKIFSVNTISIVSPIWKKYCGGTMIYGDIFLRRKNKATGLDCQRNFITGQQKFSVPYCLLCTFYA